MDLPFVKPPEDPNVNVLIYAPQKMGKSAGAGSAPGKVLYLNFDLPNATRFVHRRDDSGRIMEVGIPEWELGKPRIEPLMTEVAKRVSDPSQTEIDSVVVDPVGEFYRQLLEDYSGRAISPSLPQHLACGVQIERFCRHLCKSPVNAVIVCHELAIKDDSTGEFFREPFTGTNNPALGQKLLSMVDIIAYAGVVELEDGSKEYMAQLFPGKGRKGGDRFDCLGDVRPLDIAEWVDAIKAYEDAHPPKPQSNGKAKVSPALPPKDDNKTKEEVAA